MIIIRAVLGLLTVIPLMLVPMALYTLVGLAGPVEALMTTIPLPSGGVTLVSYADAVVCVGCATLLLEVMKATNTGAQGILDLVLSVVLLITAILAFVLIKGYAGPSFLILIGMQAVDVLGGTAVAIKSARRDFGIGGA